MDQAADYSGYIRRKLLFLGAGGFLLIAGILASLSLGSVSIPFGEVIKVLTGSGGTGQWQTIILRIRLPQALTALSAGIGLATSGAVMQSILRNPLGSPFTLGISNAAAFGAAFSVMLLGTGAMGSRGADAVIINNPYATTATAFLFCMLAAGVILLIARIKHSSPEIMVLAGVALGSLFTAGTMFLQYFADDVQLAAMVFWTFGDLARAGWRELIIITVVSLAALVYFWLNRWNFNSLSAGDETARSLGVPVGTLRLAGMMSASLVTATIISCVGIIGFVGLICPHMVRRLIGDDHRFLIPGAALTGGILLLAADTAARLLLRPHVLPVAILTSFLGAPLFLYLLIKGYHQ